MPLRNIYFSGPDGTRKSTLANETARFLELEGFHALVIHFPTETGLMGSLIQLRQNRDERLLAEEALDFAYAADRLDTAHHKLNRLREVDPNIILISDRGPADGAVYAVARDQMRESPLGITFEYMEKIDSKFLGMFPVDLGICLLSSVEEAQRVMQERGIKDKTDANLELQARLNGLFAEYLGDRPKWKIIKVDRYPEESRRAQAERLTAKVKLIIRDEIKKSRPEGNPSLSPEKL